MNRENKAITKKGYINIKTIGVDLKEKFKNVGFDDEEIKEINFEGQIYKEANEMHGSSYGHFSSFLYYDESKDSREEVKSKSRIEVDKAYKEGKDWGNIDTLQSGSDSVVNNLKAGVVMIGANAGTGAKDLSFEHFENFHNLGGAVIKKYSNSFTNEVDFYVRTEKEILDQSLLEEYGLKKISNRDKKGFIRYNKYKDEEALKSDNDFFKSCISGSYLTDLVKGLPTTDSKELSDYIKKSAGKLYDGSDKYKRQYKSLSAYKKDFEKRFASALADILTEEFSALEYLTHTLVIMNSKSSTFINNMLELGGFREKYKEKSGIDINIRRVNHYTSSTPQHIWRYQLEEVYQRKDRSNERMKIWLDTVNSDPRLEGVNFVYRSC